MTHLESGSAVELGSYLESIETQKRIGVPVYEIEPGMPRSDSLSVLEEGALFGYLDDSTYVTVCTTIAASPHVTSTVSKELFQTVAEEIYGSDSQLPLPAQELRRFAPQTIIWWSIKDGQSYRKESDLVEIYKLGDIARSDAVASIAAGIRKSVTFVNRLKGNSIIWGAWGGATLQERATTGLSRGVPTNRIGHSHVLHIEEELATATPVEQEPSTSDILHWLDPWTAVIHQKYGDVLQTFLQESINSRATSGEQVKITRQSPDCPDTHSKVGSFYGFDVAFEGPVELDDALEVLCILAGTLDELYDQSKAAHKNYQTNMADPDLQKSLLASFRDELVSQGMDTETARSFSEFVATIQPTLIQVENWIKEGNTDLMATYTRLANKAKKVSAKISLIAVAAADTNKSSEGVSTINHTLPVRSTGWYLFEDVIYGTNGVSVKNFKFMPSLSSSKAAPERIMGGIQRRALS